MTLRLVIAESESYSPRGLALFLKCGWTVENYQGPLSSLPPYLSSADGAIVRFGLKWNAETLQKVGALKFIAVPATGTDHIDRPAAEKAGIKIVSLAGHPGLKEITATPEHAFGLMMALLRNTVPAVQSVLSGHWNRDAYFGRQLKGKTVGIIGLGRTGTAFAGMVSAFDARVTYYDPYVKNGTWDRCLTLSELAEKSDVIAVHAVYNEETKGLLDAGFFSTIKPGGWLVNTARGGIVDETAMITALERGQLAGAALDVMQNEPAKNAPLQSPLVDYARSHPNVIITPHIGGATRESIDQAEYLLAMELVRMYGR